MQSMIRGIPVTLYEKMPAGTDALNAPGYEEMPVVVKNVLVMPVSSEDAAEALRLYGKQALYELCIPKGDAHTWEDSRVDFFGQSFLTIGFAQEYIEANLPLCWNKKIQAVRYG